MLGNVSPPVHQSADRNWKQKTSDFPFFSPRHRHLLLTVMRQEIMGERRVWHAAEIRRPRLEPGSAAYVACALNHLTTCAPSVSFFTSGFFFQCQIRFSKPKFNSCCYDLELLRRQKIWTVAEASQGHKVLHTSSGVWQWNISLTFLIWILAVWLIEYA